MTVMANYAFLDANNIVTEVIPGKDEGGDIDWEWYYGGFRNQKCLRTSINTFRGVHFFGKEPFRKNYAGIGYFYDEQKDAFIPPKPFASWVLNDDICDWEPPKPYPQDYGIGEGKSMYVWNEESLDWVKTT